MASKNILALDIGHKRIGVATANTAVPIAVLRPTIVVDGSDQQQIRDMITANRIDTLVVGYPRNQQGQPTAQTEFATQYAKAFAEMSHSRALLPRSDLQQGVGSTVRVMLMPKLLR